MKKEELKDGVFYKLLDEEYPNSILQYNSKDLDNCRGYWEGKGSNTGWADYWGFNERNEWREATLEELNALGDEHLPYSKYLQVFLTTTDGVDVSVGDKVAWVLKHGDEQDYEYLYMLKLNEKHKHLLGDESFYAIFSTQERAEQFLEKQNTKANLTYTLKDLSEGRVAVINNGTPEELWKVLQVAFPHDKTVSYKEFREDFNRCIFFNQSKYDHEGEWESNTETDLPTQSVKVFLQELDRGEVVATLHGRVEDEIKTFKFEDGKLETQDKELIDFLSGQPKQMREFATGATRNLSDDKLDFEGFLSPLAIEEFAKYMHTHRLQADGKLRDSDNWQKGIPLEAYMKSMYRHFFDVWKSYRGYVTPDNQITNLCALMFNVQGMLHELLKSK